MLEEEGERLPSFQSRPGSRGHRVLGKRRWDDAVQKTAHLLLFGRCIGAMLRKIATCGQIQRPCSWAGFPMSALTDWRPAPARPVHGAT